MNETCDRCGPAVRAKQYISLKVIFLALGVAVAAERWPPRPSWQACTDPGASPVIGGP